MPTNRLCLALLALVLAACHDEGMSASPDLAPPPAPYPAIAPDQPQVVTLGGPVLASPKVVAITFDGDPFRTDIEAMLGSLGATSYWHDTTAEYGVGPIELVGTVHLAEAPPAAITDEEIQAWLAAQLDGTHLEWPALERETIYAVFYPETTTITQQGATSCSEFGGYHADAAPAGVGPRIIYAVLPRCHDPRLTVLQYLTSATSHELIEASQDPQPLTNAAYTTVDEAHFPWARLVGGGETADLCAQEPTAPFEPEGFGYTVQRSWSNAAALAGQDPCVPAVSDPPYFNVTPTTPLDDVTLTFGGGTLDVKGWEIAVGESRTIDFMRYSTAPTSGPFTVEAIDLTAARTGGKSTLQLTFDQATGANGDAFKLTITATAKSSSRLGATTVMVRSKLDKVQHYWLGLVHTP